MTRLHALVAILAAVNGPAAAQTVLRPGQTVQGELMASDSTLPDGSHYDCFTIQTRPGQKLQIDQTSDAFDSYLLAGSGSCGALGNIISDNDSGDGRNSRLTFEGDGSNLIIRVNSASGGATGPYSLRIAEPGRSGAESVSTSNATSFADPASPSSRNPFDTPAILVTSTAGSGVFGLPVEFQRDGLRLFPGLWIFKTPQRTGRSQDGRDIFVDAALIGYIINCRDLTFRMSYRSIYFNRSLVDIVHPADPFGSAERGSVPYEIINKGCQPEIHALMPTYEKYQSKIDRVNK